MQTDTNITIIGAGVIGLAIAAKLSETYDGVYVLEKNNKFGQETSSRNSEVIHSGIYYPTNTLKAKLCVQGNPLLYNYCDTKGVQYKKCGKIIVATNEAEELQLANILKQSKLNGVEDGRYITKEEIKYMEPNVRAHSGLHFPSTGIIDSHGLMKQLAIDSTIKGVEIVYNSEVLGINQIPDAYKIKVKEGTGKYSFTTNTIINAAGLFADEISELVGINDNSYKIYYWKGEYFAIANGKNKLVNRLIYPVPNENTTGLGVHATIDLNNGLRLGPNTIYLNDKKIDYTVDKSHLLNFYKSVRSFLPFIEISDLHQNQAGIRPKLQKPGDPIRDFIIVNESQRGLKNFINLIGIESPGLTSCLAIAEYINKELLI